MYSSCSRLSYASLFASPLAHARDAAAEKAMQSSALSNTAKLVVEHSVQMRELHANVNGMGAVVMKIAEKMNIDVQAVSPEVRHMVWREGTKGDRRLSA